MKRTMTPRAAEMARQVEHLPVVDAALDDRVDLDRREAGLARRADAVQHPVEAVEAAAHARGRSSGSIESRLTVTRFSPCAASSAACWASSTPLVVSARSSMPSIADSSPTRSGKPGAQQRLAAGQADLAHALGRERAREPHDFVEGKPFRGGQEAVAVAEGRARHAVRATEIAAVHDRDAQVERAAGRARRRPRAALRSTTRLLVIGFRSWPTSDRTEPRAPRDASPARAATRRSRPCRRAR